MTRAQCCSANDQSRPWSSACNAHVLPLGVLRLAYLVLQQTTRQMQSLCAHGKDVGDASMSKEAPVVKKLLEEFIFRQGEISIFAPPL